MEQKQYRFYNYKTYQAFQRDLDSIPKDAIVFIQDKLRIWTHGKEYVCDGPNTADIQNGTFTFKNGKDEIIFSASQKDGTITLTDGSGNFVSTEYVLKDWFDNAISAINRNARNAADDIASLEESYTELARDKQNKLTAGENIRIKNNIISAVIDVDLYIMTQSLDSVENPNPNKIYLLETTDQDGKVVYQQYKYQDGEWVSVGVADTKVNMSEYLEQEYRYLQENYQPKGNYANKSWVENTFVKKSSVYTPQDGISEGGSGNNEGSSDIVIPSGSSNIVVDNTLSTISANPVENRTITIALQGKADVSQLQQYAKKSEIADSYVTNAQHLQDLNNKQEKLIAGNGISISPDGKIDVTLDTDFMVITRSLQAITNPNPNKIYLLESEGDEGSVYTEYRYDEDSQEWIKVGEKAPNINLESYMTREDVEDNYLLKTDAQSTYATNSDLAAVDDKFDNYSTTEDLDTALSYIRSEYQKRGNYVFAEQVSTALSVLQRIIDQKYVLKKDVYRPGESGWSSETPTQISVEGTEGSTEGGTGAASNMVTLTEQEYQSLVNKGLVDESTYYFTYEGKEETTNWTFGGTFPVILGGDSAIGEFPITLS